MVPRLFETFWEAFTKEVNRQLIERRTTLVAQRKELERVERDLDRAIQAILDGVPGAQLKDKIGALEARKADLTAILAEAKEPSALLHPNMAHLYRERLAALHEALEEKATRAEAAEAIRVLIDRVTLVPDNGGLSIVLRGDLAAMLSFAGQQKVQRRFRGRASSACGASIGGCGGRKPPTAKLACRGGLSADSPAAGRLAPRPGSSKTGIRPLLNLGRQGLDLLDHEIDVRAHTRSKLAPVLGFLA